MFDLNQTLQASMIVLLLSGSSLALAGDAGTPSAVPSETIDGAATANDEEVQMICDEIDSLAGTRICWAGATCTVYEGDPLRWRPCTAEGVAVTPQPNDAAPVQDVSARPAEAGALQGSPAEAVRPQPLEGSPAQPVESCESGYTPDGAYYHCDPVWDEECESGYTPDGAYYHCDPVWDEECESGYTPDGAYYHCDPVWTTTPSDPGASDAETASSPDRAQDRPADASAA